MQNVRLTPTLVLFPFRCCIVRVVCVIVKHQVYRFHDKRTFVVWHQETYRSLFPVPAVRAASFLVHQSGENQLFCINGVPSKTQQLTDIVS